MKKTLLIGTMMAACVAVYAQGTVNFANTTGTKITNSATGAAVITGTTFRVALYYAADAVDAPADADFTMLGNFSTINTPTAGQFSGGTRTAPTAAAGGPAWFWVKAWENKAGTATTFATFEAMLAAQADFGGRQGVAGTSGKFRMPATGNPPTVPTKNIVPPDGGLAGFVLNPVPEPSVIGLGVLGFGVLMLLRRRK